MTYRDPAPTVPACPRCDSPDDVRAHENPHQGRWLCLGCMFLFNGLASEVAPSLPERLPAPNEIAHARASLRGGAV